MYVERRHLDQIINQNHELTAAVNFGIEPFSIKPQPRTDKPRPSIDMQPLYLHKKTRNLDGSAVTYNSIASSPADAAFRVESAKRPILRATTPRFINNKKTVTIMERRRSTVTENTSEQSIANYRPSKLAIPTTEKSSGLLDTFRNCLRRNKTKTSPTEKIETNNNFRETETRPEIEQFSFLNSNLNPWESGEEKVLRRKGRRKISMKGAPIRKSVNFFVE